MGKSNAVEVVVIADRSGSMGFIVDDAIGGYNQFLEEQKRLKGKANLTLVLFDHEYIVHEDGIPLKEAKPLTRESYVPRGSTALNDAVGRAIVALEAKNPKKAIVCIITDGQENCSREFTSQQVKDKIKAAEDSGWQVIYLSADANAFANSTAIGINIANTVQFANNAAGVRSAYKSVTASTTAYRGAK